MHDNHEPTCSFCAEFVFPFEKDSPLADWGYCRGEWVRCGISQEKLKEIEEEVKKGDYSFLSKGDIPLYQPLGEGCAQFMDSDHPWL